ncbi:xanthine dehydrogenase family protein molybdopterin-binding subunit [Hanstruepera marina]|uniref:xanthine dehydrogenase family protein molybdopterin-binding subunit n=1 Tax=Hanstruepera marina TaxID=2873265 RepID=UPI001CA6A0F9|nr:molybdopterin cofactor-binding domain-containing protein [Hanstruepera marina]
MKKSNQIQFSRRAFIRTSALASGGMLIGFNLFTACKDDVVPPKELIDLSQLNYNDFNAYIKISPEGKVTIFSPNPEIGQGVKTSMPMLVAEELDIPWEDVYVQQAPLDTKNFKRQMAGGSRSISLAWEPLRQTGATAKQMLINAAATKWGVDATDCSAKQGLITNKVSGETLGYGDVVNEAATLEVPEKVTLKDPKDFNIIGQGKNNVDIDEIITGKPLFGLDYKEEGMVYACVLRPPAFGQELESFDDSAARTIEGVIDVVTIGEKVRELLKKEDLHWSVNIGSSDKVVVIANSTWSAFKGKKAIKAIWKNTSPLESSEYHSQELAKVIDSGDFNTLREDGDVKQAFSNADNILERTYESTFLPHNCLEPMNFFANVTDDKIHLVGPIQTPEGSADTVSKLLDRNKEDIYLEMTRMGGGFGRRLYGDFVYEAAEISDAIRKPVKVISSREDDMTTGIYRPPTKYKFSASIKDNKVTGYHLKEACINGNSWPQMSNFFPAGAIENYKYDIAQVNSNITAGAWRAPITNFLASAEQSFFDELAEELKIDRIQLHKDLLQNVKGTTDERIQYSPERLEGVIDLAVDKSNWGKTPEDIYQGFAVYYCHNTHVAEVADIKMENGYPVVKKVTVAVDCGVVVNPLGAQNQVVGGVIDGLGHMMYGELTFKDGVPQSSNFNSYQLIRMNQTPYVDVHFVKSDIAPTGLGEPTLPPVGAAVANAIYAATGQRLYKQPFMKYFKPEALKA